VYLYAQGKVAHNEADDNPVPETQFTNPILTGRNASGSSKGLSDGTVLANCNFKRPLHGVLH
jgi:hypothetical protein